MQSTASMIEHENTKINLDKYLERIKFRGLLSASLNCLKDLHRSHVMVIPFEALDV